MLLWLVCESGTRLCKQLDILFRVMMSAVVFIRNSQAFYVRNLKSAIPFIRHVHVVVLLRGLTFSHRYGEALCQSYVLNAIHTSPVGVSYAMKLSVQIVFLS